MTKPKILLKFKNFLSHPGRIKFFKISAIVILAGIFIFTGIRYYLQLREKTGDPWNFVPDNVLSVIQVNEIQDFVITISNNSLFADFDQLLLSSEIQKNFLFYDSLFSTKEPIQEAWIKGPLLISTNFMGSDRFEIIFIKPLPHPSQESRVYQFFEKHAASSSVIDLQGHKEKARKYTFGNETIFVCIKDGICLFSSTTAIIESALKASNSSNLLKNDAAFEEVKATSGKKCMANLYINYRFLYRFISKILNGESLKSLEPLNQFAGWSSYDIHFSDQKVYCTGFTSIDVKNPSWLSVFSDSEPQSTDIVNILPGNTTAFIWFGFNKYEHHRETYKQYLTATDGIQDFNNNLTNLKRRTGIQNINDLIFPHIDNQMALFSVPEKSAKSLNHYAAFKISDLSTFRKNLNEIVRSASKTNKTSADTSSYRNHLITTIPADYMLFDLFGKLFSPIEKTCYTIFNGFWVVGNSHEAMKDFLNQVTSGRLLIKNPYYEEFSQSVSGEANIYFYASPRKLKNEIRMWFNEEKTDHILKNISEFDNFEGIGIQFSSKNSMFLSGITLFRSTETNEESTSGWEITLDGQTASGPWFVDVADQTTKNIITFDAFNNMYFVSDKGEVLWKIPVAERPISKIFTVDAFKNGKFQYLFNSENYLFLIDRNGKSVENFPLKLPVQAAGPINVFDYDSTKDYRILFIGTDNIIYNYTIKGEPTSGWEKPKLKNEAQQHVRHLRLVNTDVLYVKTNNNQPHFFTRRGLPMFEMKDITLSQYSEIYAASKLCRCFITTTSDGQIAMISTNGEIEYKIIHEAGAGHVFMYEDMDKDGQTDFIFIEKGKAYIFDQDGNIISGLEINSDAGRNAGFIKDSPYGPLLYVFSSDGSELYLVNKTGRILPEEIFRSANSADFNMYGDAGKLIITSSRGNSLYLYVIE